MSGDPPFWPGLADMFGGGYNAHVWLAGATRGWAFPASALATGRAGS